MNFSINYIKNIILLIKVYNLFWKDFVYFQINSILIEKVHPL